VFFLCKSKLRQVSFGNLWSVFRSDFYWSKIQTLFNRAEF
jgi:hypothetical protein